MLSDKIKNFIRKHAKTEYPNECCGIILGERIVACKNISEYPLDNFIIDPDELNKFNINDITAFYHSHKEIEDFSTMDIAFSEKLNKKSVLYICDKDIFKEYNPLGIKIPYIGRPFFMGEFDCFTLTKEYFKRELNIEIADISEFINDSLIKNYKKWKTEEFKEYENSPLVKDFFMSQGFSEVNDPKKNDIFLIKMPGVKFTCHICIYLGENKILHHFSDLSGISSYTSALKRLTTHIMRHESLK